MKKSVYFTKSEVSELFKNQDRLIHLGQETVGSIIQLKTHAEKNINNELIEGSVTVDIDYDLKVRDYKLDIDNLIYKVSYERPGSSFNFNLTFELMSIDVFFMSDFIAEIINVLDSVDLINIDNNISFLEDYKEKIKKQRICDVKEIYFIKK